MAIAIALAESLHQSANRTEKSRREEGKQYDVSRRQQKRARARAEFYAIIDSENAVANELVDTGIFPFGVTEPQLLEFGVVIRTDLDW